MMGLEKILAVLIFIIFGSYLFFMDFKYLRLPESPVFLLLWMGLVFNINQNFSPLDQAVLGVIVGYGSLWLIFWIFKYITGKEGLGYGDFKLLGAMGGWFGLMELPRIILMASGLGLVLFGLRFFLERKIKNGLEIKIPLGALILLAGFLEFFK